MTTPSRPWTKPSEPRNAPSQPRPWANGHAPKIAATPAPAAIDRSETERFLALLDPSTDEFTFSAFDDEKKKRVTENFIQGTLDARLAELAKFNARSAGIFVMVNAGDGKGRKGEFVTHVRAVWQDDDQQWEGTFPLPPSIVVQTSIDRFQRYWLVDGLTADDHEAVMERMVSDYGSDIGAKDLPRVLRLPGFLHRKREPNYLVRIIEASGKRYSREEILAAFPPIEREKPAPYAPRAIEPGDDDEERLRDALATIPPSSREIRVSVGMALKDHYGPSGFEAWEHWLSSSPNESNKSKLAERRSRWTGFKGHGLTVGSVFHLAKAFGWKSHRDMEEPDAETKAMVARLVGGTRGATEPEPQAEPDNEPQPYEAEAESFPDDLTHPGGLVGDIIDWIEATARYPSRSMALAAALAVVGTAMGREWQGPSNSSTTLYALVLAPTGGGKDHILEQAALLMYESGMSTLIGPDNFQSANALANFVHRRPLSLSIMDEFGAFLGRITHRNASSFSRDTSALLRKFWSIKFKCWRSSEYANKAFSDVWAPAVNLLGAAPPKEFYAALQGTDVANGFFNRFFIISSLTQPVDRDPLLPPFEVPKSLSEALKFAATRGRLPDKERPPDERIFPTMVQWGPGGKEEDDNLNQEIALRILESGEEPDLFVRVRETAIRIATIAGYGRDMKNPVIDGETMNWAGRVSLWSNEQMRLQFNQHSAESEHQALAKEVVRHVKEGCKGPGKRLPHSHLLKKLKHKFRSREIKDVVELLIASGDIQFSKGEQGKNGKAAIYYAI